MSRRQKNPTNPNTEWPPARIAQLRRKVWSKMRKFRNSKELQYLIKRDEERARQATPRPAQEDRAYEKAPGVAAEGFSTFFRERDA
jgi:hypothetical protein